MDWLVTADRSFGSHIVSRNSEWWMGSCQQEPLVHILRHGHILLCIPLAFSPLHHHWHQEMVEGSTIFLRRHEQYSALLWSQCRIQSLPIPFHDRYDNLMIEVVSQNDKIRIYYTRRHYYCSLRGLKNSMDLIKR